jgi:hypothetical protein
MACSVNCRNGARCRLSSRPRLHWLSAYPLTPLRAESMTLDERLARLEEAGEITLPRRKKGLGRVRAARVRGRPVAETLLEDRR